MLGRYVREEKVITMEEAIRKMTSANAAKVRQFDRGLLRPGMAADVTVFNAATIIDNATYEKPHQYATGVEYVIVNGKGGARQRAAHRGASGHDPVRPGKEVALMGYSSNRPPTGIASSVLDEFGFPGRHCGCARAFRHDCVPRPRQIFSHVRRSRQVFSHLRRIFNHVERVSEQKEQ